MYSGFISIGVHVIGTICDQSKNDNEKVAEKAREKVPLNNMSREIKIGSSNFNTHRNLFLCNGNSVLDFEVCCMGTSNSLRNIGIRNAPPDRIVPWYNL